MAVATSYGRGRVQAGESDLVFEGRAVPRKRGIIWCHEHGATGLYLLNYLQFGHRLLAEQGAVVISTDLGGTTTWGNDTSQSRIQQAWNWLVANKGVPSDQVILMTYSMGTLAALNWARANRTKVAAIAGVTPAVDLASFHDGNLGGFATEIETAYGGQASYTAAEEDHNPAAHAADYAGIPIKLWYTTDDPLVLPATIASFAAASGAAVESLGTGGHSANNMTPQPQYEFLRPYL